ncbi:MAG: hypothetical protein ACUZ8O_16860 [Candidatus Anammoxibacter sp.]
MKFEILMGIPEMSKYWNDLCKRAENNKLENEIKLFRKLIKALYLLRDNPKHNSLSTHEIKPLTSRYGRKVWQSYLESRTPAAGRIFWTYGPNKHQITIVGIEPHPEDKKKSGYQKVKLSALPI